MLKNLTIVTIAHNENDGLEKTFNSIYPLLNDGAEWILVINIPLKNFVPPSTATLIEGKDSGLYDAMNIGLNQVKTEYFIMLHSGDVIFDIKAFKKTISYFEFNFDCVLGGALIGNRIHISKKWKKWMFNLYVQPPHLPIIYKSTSCINLRYDTRIPVVADFYYLKSMFQQKGFRFKHGNEIYVRMATGGLTTSGFKSFAYVTRAFFKIDGLRALLLAPFRFFLKVLLK